MNMGYIWLMTTLGSRHCTLAFKESMLQTANSMQLAHNDSFTLRMWTNQKENRISTVARTNHMRKLWQKSSKSTCNKYCYIEKELTIILQFIPSERLRKIVDWNIEQLKVAWPSLPYCRFICIHTVGCFEVYIRSKFLTCFVGKESH